MRLILALLLAACASNPVPVPAPVPVPGSSPKQRLFDFHSTFLVNLHERLWAESSPRGRPTPDAPPAWTAAVDTYRRRFPDRGLEALFAADAIALRAALQSAGGAAEPPAGIDPELAATLRSAAEVYRPAMWRADDARNRAWVAAVEPRIAALGATLAADLGRAYQTPWPDAPIRVEVSAFAGPVGAFTSLRPTRIAVASGDPRYQDDAALEMLFHEASHGLVERIDAGLANAAAAQGKPVPPRLWHALLFFTTGEIVARRIPGYVPYATKNGLYQRSPEMGAYERAMRAEWLPWLDGKNGFDAALAGVVRAL